ncbi:MAG: acetyl-CoA hydrolase [Burkholderiales bacterium]|nr:acetyl-CoA hydrolase [Burkholderiales bacterium]
MKPAPRAIEPAALDLREFIRAGDLIVVAQGPAEPTTLTRALLRQIEKIGPVTVFLGVTMADTFGPDAPAELRFMAYGGVGRNAALARAGRLTVVPCHYSQLPALFASGGLKADVVLSHAARLADGSSFTLGATFDGYVSAAARGARSVLLEVSPASPRIAGGELDADIRIDAVIPTDAPLVSVGPAAAGAAEMRIATHVAGLVEDGATLQMGIGALPDAILTALKSHRRLGMHSGLFTETAMELVDAGALDNSMKPFDTGVSTVGMLAGSTDFYRRIDGDARLYLRPATVTHGITTLAQLPRFTSLNSAIEVDLTGQVNAEVAGGAYIGGFGGQLDFVRGAAASPGGISIIALPSTTRGDSVSRIARTLSGPVTTPSADVDCVVTEWGVARLKGVPFDERRKRLVAIAHPKFRDELSR